MTGTGPGTPTKSVTLRLLDKADKEIVKLDRAIVGAVYKFQHEFRKNPEAGGFDLKQLKGHDRLWSARVNREYRALLLRLAGDDWLLVSVKHRGHVHRNLDRLTYGINQVTGAIEYVDLQVVEEGVLRPTAPTAQAPPPSRPRRCPRHRRPRRPNRGPRPSRGPRPTTKPGCSPSSLRNNWPIWASRNPSSP